ncbi:MAG: S1 RNA-binding domain-containing protein [Phycisphaerales bacterium]
MSYAGAFVRLEDGIEGLVHISEMSWTHALTTCPIQVKRSTSSSISTRTRGRKSRSA